MLAGAVAVEGAGLEKGVKGFCRISRVRISPIR